MNPNSLRHLASSLVAASVLLAGSASAATTIETLSSWDGSSYIAFWGVPNTEIYGQSVTAPVGSTTLTGFSFRIRDTAVAIGYSANVYAWDGSGTTGPALFSLPGRSFGGGGTTAFLPVSFTTSVAVTPGSQYMLYLSTFGQQQARSETVWGGIPNSDPYPDGRFFYIDSRLSSSV